MKNMDNFTFCPLIILENGTVFCDGKLRMVIWNHWNVSERQQPDRIAEVTNGSSSQQENPVP